MFTLVPALLQVEPITNLTMSEIRSQRSRRPPSYLRDFEIELEPPETPSEDTEEAGDKAENGFDGECVINEELVVDRRSHEDNSDETLLEVRDNSQVEPLIDENNG